MSETRGDARYTMGRSKEEEEERLIQQSQLYDAVTRRLLNMAGLDSGMRVLDIGSGTGDVAMTAAEVVGPEGAVVGVDVNPAILETARARAGEAGFENVEFVAGDARTLDLGGDFRRPHRPPGPHVHGRSRRRPQAAGGPPAPGGNRRLPGGRLQPLPEYVSRRHAPDESARRLGSGRVRALGGPPRHGLDLYRAYVEAGLPEPYMHFESPVGGPEDWAGYSFIANSFRSLVPLLEQFGMATADQVDVDTLAERVRREVVTSKRPLRLPPHVTAWTRLPG